MAKFSVCWSSMVSFPAPADHNCNHHLLNFTTSTNEVHQQGERRKRSVTVSAAKSGGFASVSLLNSVFREKINEKIYASCFSNTIA